MKMLSFLLYLIVVSFSISAQDISTLIKEAEATEILPNEWGAYNKYKAILEMQPQNVQALAKCSELCSRIGSREPDAGKKGIYFNAALTYAKRAMKAAPLNDMANVSMAMALGKSSLTKSGKDKVKSVKEIKRLVEVAIRSNPNNYIAWHILGRWNYEVSNVNSFERAAARIFLGGIPEGSIKNAIMYFEKAKTISPYFILNNIELAKAYKKNNETIKAIAILKLVQSYPISTEDDTRLKSDALGLIASWS